MFDTDFSTNDFNIDSGRMNKRSLHKVALRIVYLPYARFKTEYITTSVFW